MGEGSYYFLTINSKFLTEHIMGAQNFILSLKSPQSPEWGFPAPNFVLLKDIL